MFCFFCDQETGHLSAEIKKILLLEEQFHHQPNLWQSAYIIGVGAQFSMKQNLQMYKGKILTCSIVRILLYGRTDSPTCQPNPFYHNKDSTI